MFETTGEYFWNNSSSKVVKMVLKAIVLLFTILGAALFFAVLNDLLPQKPPKPIIKKKWFGPGKKPTGPESKDIVPFKINFGDKVLLK